MLDKNQRREVTKLFSEVSKAFKDNMRKSFENVGLTMPQGMVIGTLMKHGQMKISELSQKIHLSNSTISGIVDRLEKGKLVERKRSEEDKRIVYVSLTPKFCELKKDIYQGAEKSFEQLLDQATPEELQTIMDGLTVLLKVLNDRN